MESNERTFMEFGNGLDFYTNKDSYSEAYAQARFWLIPKNTGNLTISPLGNLYFAGGKNPYFNPVDVEVWGLH